MDVNGGRAPCNNNNNHQSQSESDEETLADLRRGPWTVEEDLTLINYIATHGEGRWNSLARCAGLKRTGKSCRLRWLNYLRPDVRRGNITLEEQLLILELHSRWGNRWSKIAQYLPGRTDNEIKNYWRTRVQKHAKQLKCDVNSKQFKDAMKYLWMPRLVERIQATSGGASTSGAPSGGASTSGATSMVVASPEGSTITTNTTTNGGGGTHYGFESNNMDSIGSCYGGAMEMNSGSTGSSVGLIDAPMTDYQGFSDPSLGYFPSDQGTEPVPSYYPNNDYGGLDFQAMDQNNDYQWWMDSGEISGNLWNVEEINWYLNHNV